MARILLIDDDALVRGMLAATLRKAEHLVLEASNGVDGVDSARTEKPDLVITDMLMPDKEGMQTIMEIKALDANIKIIAISSGGSAKNMSFLELAKKAGANDVLAKPFKPDILIEKIKSLLH